MTKTQTTEAKIELERTIKAPIDKVWAAWTQADMLGKWFAPGDMGVEVHSCEVKIGGQYEITMVGDDGRHTATGTYTAIDEPKRLAMTWNWTGEGAMPNDTDLEITLEPVDGGTRLVLLHTRLPNQDAADHHTEGWVGCLANLEKLFS